MSWIVTVQEPGETTRKRCSAWHPTRSSAYRVRLHLIKINSGSGKKFFLKKA